MDHGTPPSHNIRHHHDHSAEGFAVLAITDVGPQTHVKMNLFSTKAWYIQRESAGVFEPTSPRFSNCAMKLDDEMGNPR
jgi:hypothetical protein